MNVTIAETRALKTLQCLAIRLQRIDMSPHDYQSVAESLSNLQRVVLANIATREIGQSGVSLAPSEPKEELNEQDALKKRIQGIRERELAKFARPRPNDA